MCEPDNFNRQSASEPILHLLHWKLNFTRQSQGGRLDNRPAGIWGEKLTIDLLYCRGIAASGVIPGELFEIQSD